MQENQILSNDGCLFSRKGLQFSCAAGVAIYFKRYLSVDGNIVCDVGVAVILL